MSFFIEPREKMVDLITDAQILAKRPAMKERLDAVAELRQAHDDLATYTSYGRIHAGNGEYKRVASIPHTILQTALLLEPDLLVNKTKFYKWLDRHPEYYAYNRKRG